MISDRLNQQRDERRQQKRSLSNHVVSRYYRAPEIILLEKQYDSSVDMWSAGCIFAEMLNCLQSDEKLKLKDRILFPGKSCYPLSPDDSKNPESENDEVPDKQLSKKDQLKKICRIIGTPNSNDKSFITD